MGQYAYFFRSIERGYTGRCDVFEYQKIKKENHSTGFQEIKVLENERCKVSFKSISSASSSPGAAEISQEIKLFISPDLVIKEGSKIVVTQNGRTTQYKNSGTPAVYPTHQEIILELFNRWA